LTIGTCVIQQDPASNPDTPATRSGIFGEVIRLRRSTMRISDPAPLTLDLEPRRHGGVHGIRLGMQFHFA